MIEWKDAEDSSAPRGELLYWGAVIILQLDGSWFVAHGVDHPTQFHRVIPSNTPARRIRYFHVHAGPFDTREAAKAAYTIMYGDQHD